MWGYESHMEWTSIKSCLVEVIAYIFLLFSTRSVLHFANKHEFTSNNLAFDCLRNCSGEFIYHILSTGFWKLLRESEYSLQHCLSLFSKKLNNFHRSVIANTNDPRIKCNLRKIFRWLLHGTFWHMILSPISRGHLN